MENFDKVSETFHCKAIISKMDLISKNINELSTVLLNKPRIPNVVHLSKSYDSFTIKVQNQKEINQDKCSTENNVDNKLDKTKDSLVAILVSDMVDHLNINQNIVNIEITTNINFYSHSELIKMLTPTNIEFSAYELIGDIVHLNLNDQQQKYKNIIADIIHYKTEKTVINKVGKIDSTFRFYESEVLAGRKILTTVHKENDVKIFLDLEKVYWCSRLQAERVRIIKMIKPGQIVCDPFCGVGPHVLPAIKKGATALCNDLNPSAIDCLMKSLELNKLHCETVECTDAAVFLDKNSSQAVDHFIFNLPEHSLEYIKYTEKYNKEFLLHVFFFCRVDQKVEEHVKAVTGYKTKKDWLREVRKVSPAKSVFKLEVKSVEFFEYQRGEQKNS